MHSQNLPSMGHVDSPPNFQAHEHLKIVTDIYARRKKNFGKISDGYIVKRDNEKHCKNILSQNMDYGPLNDNLSND